MISSHLPSYEGDLHGIAYPCGEIGEKCGSQVVQKRDLSPQDYVLLLATKEEQEQLDAFSPTKECFLLQQLTSILFANTSKPAGLIWSGQRLMNCSMSPKYLSATLIFLRSKGVTFPNFSKTAQEQKLPAFTMDWLEILSQGPALSGASPEAQST